MGAFDFVILLLSFVFALAMTHVLSRVGALVLVRERVGFSWLQVLAIVNALALVYLDWLTVWDARTVKAWNLVSITLLFAFAIANYFVCVAAAPEPVAGGRIELETFYWKNRVVFWGAVAALNVIALPTNSVFGDGRDPQLALETDLWTLPFFAPCALALVVRARWAQWLAGFALLALSVTWLVVFNGGLA